MDREGQSELNSSSITRLSLFKVRSWSSVEKILLPHHHCHLVAEQSNQQVSDERLKIDDLNARRLLSCCVHWYPITWRIHWPLISCSGLVPGRVHIAWARCPNTVASNVDILEPIKYFLSPEGQRRDKKKKRVLDMPINYVGRAADDTKCNKVIRIKWWLRI